MFHLSSSASFLFAPGFLLKKKPAPRQKVSFRKIFACTPAFMRSVYKVLEQSSGFGSLKELFRETILLNTGAPGFESLQSAQKKPVRTNW